MSLCSRRIFFIFHLLGSTLPGVFIVPPRKLCCRISSMTHAATRIHLLQQSTNQFYGEWRWTNLKKGGVEPKTTKNYKKKHTSQKKVSKMQTVNSKFLVAGSHFSMGGGVSLPLFETYKKGEAIFEWFQEAFHFQPVGVVHSRLSGLQCLQFSAASRSEKREWILDKKSLKKMRVEPNIGGKPPKSSICS